MANMGVSANVYLCSMFHTQAHENFQPKSLFFSFIFHLFIYVFIYAITNRMETKLDLTTSMQIVVQVFVYSCYWIWNAPGAFDFEK